MSFWWDVLFLSRHFAMIGHLLTSARILVIGKHWGRAGLKNAFGSIGVDGQKDTPIDDLLLDQV